jgi:hypothetical protein
MYYIQITFHNPIKTCFSNKKYAVAIQTRPTKIKNSIFLIDYLVLTGFLKVIGVQNQFPITFGTLLIRTKLLNQGEKESYSVCLSLSGLC